MREALALTRAGDVGGASRCLQAALRPPPSASADTADASVVDAEFVVVRRTSDHDNGPAPRRALPPSRVGEPSVEEARCHEPGRFIAGRYSHPAGALAYKIWIPSGGAAGRPLIVMLHGCTQDADDFARGTRMNDHAERLGCCVLYPIQAGAANAQRCWRWFSPAHQTRDRGEPAWLAGMTRQVIDAHGIDRSRVYAAGLSAGGAMALVLTDVYPDVFAAVAVHSGLPIGSAHDVPSALAVMAGRATPPVRTRASGVPVPGLVIHGTADRTVAAANGDAVVRQLLDRYGETVKASSADVTDTRTHHVKRYRDAGGTVVVEQWRVHQGGHAWSGGDPSGSYTDPQGPDASRRVLEFFLNHARHSG